MGRLSLTRPTRWRLHSVRAASPGTIELPAIDDAQTGGSGEWSVTVFNNEYNTYDEVINILMAATSCSFEEACIETWEIDHLGRSVVHYASEQECEHVAGVIRTIGIQVSVGREP
ncbi:MAG: ATP-dependent Clp protease adaptor protein ClpS [Armatimonadetes bacterium OLB18]|nr:MAG: ATP-dependent Clp protease adaptor protein ClpS [Armatimonadetes bacterium OLB18]